LIHQYDCFIASLLDDVLQAIKLFRYLVTQYATKGLQVLLDVPLMHPMPGLSGAAREIAQQQAASPAVQTATAASPLYYAGLDIHLCDMTLLLSICRLWARTAGAMDSFPANLDAQSRIPLSAAADRERNKTRHMQAVLALAKELSLFIDSVIDLTGLDKWNYLLSETNDGETLVAHCWRFYSGNCHPVLLRELQACYHLESISLEFEEEGEQENS
jgi:hypothetical protein